MPNLNQRIFPTELICRILCYTSARDVVQWRSVSKWFCAIVNEAEIWKALRANAFMPPPELLPDPSHDRTLVKLERLAQSWIQDPLQLRFLSFTEVAYTGITSGNCGQLIGGRWFIGCQFRQQFVLYDTHPDANVRVDPQVLWKQTEILSHWSILATISRESQWVAYAFMTNMHTSRCTLLELSWDEESGMPCNAITIDIPRAISIGNYETFVPELLPQCTRFLHLPDPSLVIDTSTRAFYDVPPFNLALDSTKHRINATMPQPRGRAMALTNTHMIIFRGYLQQSGERLIVAQAFTIPDERPPIKNGIGLLRLSHEGVFKGQSEQAEFAVIQNSVLNSIDGTVNIRMIERGERGLPSSIHDDFCVDLTLHKPSLTSVSPITIRRLDVVVRGHVPQGDPRVYYWDLSREGYARGLAVIDLDDEDDSIRWEATKIAINATGDKCMIFYGRDEGPVLQGGAENHRWGHHIYSGWVVDGARGKLSYVRRFDGGSLTMVVADIE